MKLKRAIGLFLVVCMFCISFPLHIKASTTEAWPRFTFQAEGSETEHNTGSLSGNGWAATPGTHAAGHIVYGQNTTSVSIGKSQAFYTMMVNDNTTNNDLVCKIEVKDKTAGTILTYKYIRRKQFKSANSYQTFALDFFQTNGHVLEFRIWWHGKVYLRVDKVAVECQNFYFQAEDTSWISHGTGSANSDGWVCQPGVHYTDADTHMSYGPYADLPAGDNYAFFRMKIDSTSGNPDDLIARIDVRDHSAGKIIAYEDIYRRDFQAGNKYQTFYIHYIQQQYNFMEFRVNWSGNTYLKLDYVGAEKVTYFREDWMSGLSDGKNLAQINIPGTHESGALYDPFAKCQYLEIDEQLNTGIRYLDIRCRHLGDSFTIHHGAVYQNQNFDDVLEDCYNFLNQNPSETIVMAIKEEYNPDENTRTFEQTFDAYVAKNPGKWHLGETIPNLGDVRGKIVLLRRFPATTFPKGIDCNEPPGWQGNATFTIEGNLAKLYIQDQYKVKESDKMNAMYDLYNLANSSQYPNYLFINYSSAAYSLIPDILGYSKRLNPWVESFFFRHTMGRFGVTAMDFVTFNLAFPIYSTNFRPLSL